MGKLYAFDIDNVLAPTEELLLPPFFVGFYELVKDEIPGVDFAQFKEETNNVYFSHGCGVRGLAGELGHGEDWILDKYKRVAPYLRDAVLPQVEPSASIKVKLEELASRGHTLVAITQGHRDYTLPLLAKLELDKVLPAARVYDIQAVGGRLKRTTYPCQMVKDFYPNMDGYVFAEDSPGNLPPAKQVGFETHLVGPKVPHADAWPFIDRTHATTDDLLDFYLAA